MSRHLESTGGRTRSAAAAVNGSALAPEPLRPSSEHPEITASLPVDHLQAVLGRVLERAASVCPTSLAVLDLDTFDAEGYPERHCLHLTTHPRVPSESADWRGLAARIRQALGADSGARAGAVEDGYVVRLVLPRGLGEGFLFLLGARPDSHAARALAWVADDALEAVAPVLNARRPARDASPLFEAMAI